MGLRSHSCGLSRRHQIRNLTWDDAIHRRRLGLSLEEEEDVDSENMFDEDKDLENFVDGDADLESLADDEEFIENEDEDLELFDQSEMDFEDLIPQIMLI